MTAPDDRFDEKAMPPPQALAGLVAFGFLFVLHVLLLSALTSNLDDVKYLTMWIGGPLLLVGYLALATFEFIRRPPLWIWGTWAAYCVALVFSVMFGAADYGQWIGWQAVATTISSLGWFLFAFGAGSTVRVARISLFFMCFIAFLTTGFGLFHFLGGFEFVENLIARGYRRRELAGESVEYSWMYVLAATFSGSREMMSTILNRQFYGVFLAGLLPLPAAGLILTVLNTAESKHRVRRCVFYGAVLVSTMICMGLTFSKAALGTLGLGIFLFPVVLHFVARVPVLRLPAWPVATALALAVVMTVLWLVRSDLRLQISAVTTSFQSRGILTGAAWSMFLDNPLFGTGPRSYIAEFPAYRSPDYHMWAISNVTLSSHNWIMDHLGETGLVGSVPWLLLNAGILTLGFRAAWRSPSRTMRVICAAFATALLLYLAGNLLTSMFRWPVGVVMTAVLLGMTAGVSITGLRGNETKQPGGLKPNAATGGIALLAIAASVFLFLQGPRALTWFSASMTHQDGLEVSHVPSELNRATDPQALAFVEQRLLESVTLLEDAVELEPTFLTAYYRLAHSYNRLGGIYRIRYLLLRRGDPTAEQKSLMARLLDQELTFQEKAFETYDRLTEYAPNYAEVHYNRALLHLTVARNCLDAVDVLDLGDEQKAYFRAEALSHLERGAESAERAMQFSNKISVPFLAGDLYARGARLFPEDSEERSAWYRRAGEIYERTSTLPLTQAVQSPGQREKERDERLRAQLRAPEMYYLARDWAEGARAYERLITEFPGAADLYKRAIDCHMRMDNPTSALNVIAGGLERNPLNIQLMLLGAEVLLQQARDGEGDYEAVLLDALTVEQLHEMKPDLVTGQELRQARELRRLAEEALSKEAH